MMWCGQSTFGRIITSHPALEGTFCGSSKWCELGRCVPWPGIGAAAAMPKVSLIFCSDLIYPNQKLNFTYTLNIYL